MINVSYNFSPYLLSQLKKIQDINREILLYPLSAKTELRLRFVATVKRIKLGLMEDGLEITEREIINTLKNAIYISGRNSKQDKISERHEIILSYKNGLDYLKSNWTVTNDLITTKDILKIHSISSKHKLKISENELGKLLKYLASSTDSPIIQSAIVKMVIFDFLKRAGSEKKLSNIASYIFLHREGLDFRGQLILERIWVNEMSNFEDHYKRFIVSGNITNWLENFSYKIAEQLSEVLDYMKKETESLKTDRKQSKSITDLTARQMQIISLLDAPQSVITNRDVQKYFGISQITASRDLAKMNMLGLLLVHGKGRSVRYTKV